MTTTLDHSPTNNLRNSWETPYPYLADVPLDQIAPDPSNERPGLAAAVEAALAAIPQLDNNERVLRLLDLGLADLVSSMQAGGLLERVKLYPLGPNRFRLSSGHRRFFSARFLGWATIPAIVEPAPAGAADADLARITANLCRADLDAVSLARGIKSLLDTHPGLTQAAVGAMLGKSQGHIANMLRLLGLPAEVHQLMEADKLTAGHGLELLRIAEPELNWDGKESAPASQVQIQFAQDAIEYGRSVSGLRGLINQWHQSQKYRRQDAARRAKEEEARAARARAQLPKDPTPEEIAAAEAERAKRDAAQAKKEAAEARQESRLGDRERVATDVIDGAIGYVAGAPPTVELLRLAARAALAGANAQVDYHHLIGNRESFVNEIDAAPDQATLLDLLVRIARATLRLDSDKRALSGNWEVDSWADKRWGLSVRIADALLEQKLINKLSHKTLTEGKPKPPADAAPPPAPAPATAPSCPGCRHPLRLVVKGRYYICDSPGGCECPWTLDLEPVLLADFYAAIDAAQGQA